MSVVIFQNVPQGPGILFEFGIDLESWVVGPRFAGLKSVSPGLHYLHWRLRRGGDGMMMAPRSGYFCFLTNQNLLVLCWDPTTEDARLITNPDQLEAVRAALPALETSLAAHTSGQEWQELTTFVKPKTLTRILPTSILSCHQHSSTSTSYHGATELAKLSIPNTLDISFTPVSKSPKEAAIRYGRPDGDDTSVELEALLDDPRDFLAEFQLALVLVVVGENFEGFEQWKAMLRILCHAFKAIPRHPALFAAFLDVLRVQLGYACIRSDDGGIGLGDLFKEGNVLLVWLSQLVGEIEDVLKLKLHPPLERAMQDFLLFAKETLKWDLRQIES